MGKPSKRTVCEADVAGQPAQRIVVADDDPDTLEGLRSLLELWGYEVETATDGQAALDQVARLHPSVVITDVVMPRMNGLELLEVIRRELPVVRVIVMTGHSQREARRQASAQGAFAFLPKPVDTTRLRSVLVGALQGDQGETPA
jgi:two-component system response regulator HydG